jgi:hypothetical protein
MPFSANPVVRCRPAVDPRRGQQRDDGAVSRLRERPARAPSSIRSGFLTQSAFTGLAQTLAYLAPSLLVFLGMNKDAVNANHIPHITVAAFLVGALLSFTTVYWWSVKTRCRSCR